MREKTSCPLQSKRIKYYELYADEFDNFDENDPFLERPKILKVTKEEKA